MDFARQQRDPARHMVGIAFVILVHALVIWALLTGLGQKVIEVVKKPMTAQIIEEIRPPPQASIHVAGLPIRLADTSPGFSSRTNASELDPIASRVMRKSRPRPTGP